jgi:hypothetical protein
MNILAFVVAASAVTINPQLERKAELVYAAAAGCDIKLTLKNAPVATNDYERGFLAAAWEAGSKLKLTANQCKRLIKDANS